MLFKVMCDGRESSIVLSKITGVVPGACKSKCRIFVEGDLDGYNSTEPYDVVCERLNKALLKSVYYNSIKVTNTPIDMGRFN